jgi:hypothetical protein
VLVTGVGVEQLLPSKPAEIKSRQEALQSIFSGRRDIFYSSYFDPLVGTGEQGKREFFNTHDLSPIDETNACHRLRCRILFTPTRVNERCLVWNRGLASRIRTDALEMPWRESRTTNVGSASRCCNARVACAASCWRPLGNSATLPASFPRTGQKNPGEKGRVPAYS